MTMRFKLNTDWKGTLFLACSCGGIITFTLGAFINNFLVLDIGVGVFVVSLLSTIPFVLHQNKDSK